MVSLDYATLRAKAYPVKARARSQAVAVFLERLFLAWISALAAFVFLFSIILTAFNVISLMQLLYVYIGISVVTLALAAALYSARRNHPDSGHRH